MNRIIPLIEQMIADVGFTGFSNMGSGISAIRKAAAVCDELGMTTGERLCNALAEAVVSGDHERAAELFSRLCCYCECISGTGEGA